MRLRRPAVLAAGAAAVAIGVAVLLCSPRGPETVVEPFDTPVPAPTTSEEAATAHAFGDRQEAASQRAEEGAVTAAAELVVAYDSPAILDERSRADLIEATAAVEHQVELTRTFSNAAGMLQDRLALTARAADDPGFVWRSVPAGWATEEYGQSSATVAIWGTGILLADGRALTQPTWTTTTVDLVWEREDWRLVSFHRTDGPAPTPAGAPDGSAARRINGFAPFSYRPVPAKAGR